MLILHKIEVKGSKIKEKYAHVNLWKSNFMLAYWLEICNNEFNWMIRVKKFDQSFHTWKLLALSILRYIDFNI